MLETKCQLETILRCVGLKYYLAYGVVSVMGQQLELVDKSGMICKVNVQYIKVTYPVDKLIKCLPDAKAFGQPTKYWVHLKLMEDVCWFLDLKILPDLKDNTIGSFWI